MQTRAHIFAFVFHRPRFNHDPIDPIGTSSILTWWSYCHMRTIILSDEDRHVVIWGLLYCHMRTIILSDEDHHVVIWGQSYCHMRTIILSYEDNHIVRWGPLCCHMRTIILSYSSKPIGYIFWDGTPGYQVWYFGWLFLYYDDQLSLPLSYHMMIIMS